MCRDSLAPTGLVPCLWHGDGGMSADICAAQVSVAVVALVAASAGMHCRTPWCCKVVSLLVLQLVCPDDSIWRVLCAFVALRWPCFPPCEAGGAQSDLECLGTSQADVFDLDPEDFRALVGPFVVADDDLCAQDAANEASGICEFFTSRAHPPSAAQRRQAISVRDSVDEAITGTEASTDDSRHGSRGQQPRQISAERDVTSDAVEDDALRRPALPRTQGPAMPPPNFVEVSAAACPGVQQGERWIKVATFGGGACALHAAFGLPNADGYITAGAANDCKAVAFVEAFFVVVTLHLGKRPGLVRATRANLELRERRRPSTQHGDDQQQPPPPQQPHCQHPRTQGRAASPSRDRARLHDPAQASSEMRQAGVGASEPFENLGGQRACNLVVGSRRSRRPGELLQTLGCEPFRPAPQRARVRATATDMPPAEPPAESWETMDSINLRSEFLKRRCVLKTCPSPVRGRYRHAQRVALEAVEAAARDGNHIAEERAWKLLGLLSVMRLHRPRDTNSIPPAELERRFNSFARGERAQLIEMAEPISHNGPLQRRSLEEEEEHRADMTRAKVRMEECRKARQALARGALAPGNQTTSDELRGPTTRKRNIIETLSDEVLNFQPASAIDIKVSLFTKVLKSAPRGSSSGPGHTTTDLLKVALDEDDSARLFHHAAVRLARAEVPACIAEAFMAYTTRSATRWAKKASNCMLAKPTCGIEAVSAHLTLRTSEAEMGAWSPAGVVLLGVPVGTPELVRAHAADRLVEERVLLSKLAKLEDPQCEWQPLSRCAAPRGNYWLRTLPPSASQQYAYA